MEETEKKQRKKIKFSKTYLAVALFPLSIWFTHNLTQNHYSQKLDEIQKAENKLKSEIAVQLETAKKLDEALTVIEKHVNQFDSSHTSLFNAVVDVEDLPQGEAFVIEKMEKPNFKSASLFGEMEQRATYLTNKLTKQNKFLETFLAVAQDKETMLESIPAVCPIYYSDLERIGSGFGMRKDPIDSTMKMHKGIDISAPTGTKVYASGTGIIDKISSSDDGYGNCIVIDHGYGFKSRYAHLSGFNVKEGDEVKKGDFIGLVGSTGRSTGPHLHYEIEKEGEKVDPKKYIKIDLKGVETY
jgi:murein DD-endopeptidase MepM/ murein hydrolase activator NlpD